jgi:hypothetical protein
MRICCDYMRGILSGLLGLVAEVSVVYVNLRLNCVSGEYGHHVAIQRPLRSEI